MKKHQKPTIILSLGLSLMGCGGVGTEEDSASLPVTTDDKASMVENGNAIEISVLDNDQPLTLLDANTVKIIETPSNGTASVVATGKVEYEPVPNYHGTDSLVYQVQDINGNFSNPATVTISIDQDTDRDGIGNLTDTDDDGDTQSDDDEITNGTNPLDPLDPERAFVLSGHGRDGAYDVDIPVHPTGTYNYNIDCGNGQSATGITSNYTCNLFGGPDTISQQFYIRITGTFSRINSSIQCGAARTYNDISIAQWGTIEWQSMVLALNGCIYLELRAQDRPNLSKVTDMSGMFGAPIHSNINNWDVSNITNMTAAFASTASNLDISNWDVSKVEDMSAMFNDNTTFNQDISNWNVGSVENMNSMFSGAINFDQNLGDWDISKVSHMSGMFAGSSVGLSTINYDSLLNGWWENIGSEGKLQPSVNFSAGESKYSAAAKTARESILTSTTPVWTITDKGCTNCP